MFIFRFFVLGLSVSSWINVLYLYFFLFKVLSTTVDLLQDFNQNSNYDSIILILCYDQAHFV
jgi:hypothetical protein